jgi:hypothetical protein
MEEYNPQKHPEHLEAAKRKFNDKLDGKVYVQKVIEWHVHKVSSSNDFLAVQMPSLTLRKSSLTF